MLVAMTQCCLAYFDHGFLVPVLPDGGPGHDRGS
jgi:hypothetical protein